MESFLGDAREFLPILAQGAVVTIQITILSLALSTLIGFVIALARLSPYALLSYPATGFITVIRGIPIIVQLFYIYFVFPDIGINLTAFQAGVLGLGIAYSAYQAENIRAGIEAIDHGQIEAAQSIGMRYWLTLRRVILPQAVRIVLPPYGNTMIMMLKDSSLASTITVAELTRQGQLISSSTFKNMTVFTLVALLYLTMSLPLTYLAHRLEKKFGRR
ncbi:MAG TPA: amino acid ABC transporter permease [Burkholderiaceae bacterium]|nr:amino acid ABC transporter permease [Burkholderiaceae bacterium]